MPVFIPQLFRRNTPTLSLWHMGMAVYMFSKETEESQLSGFGNTLMLTLLGKCESSTSSFCVQSERRAGSKEDSTDAVAVHAVDILAGSHFASVLYLSLLQHSAPFRVHLVNSGWKNCWKKD